MRTKGEKYFGFKGHLVISTSDLPIAFTIIAAAHINERNVRPEVVKGIQGMLIADKGFAKEELAKRQ